MRRSGLGETSDTSVAPKVWLDKAITPLTYSEKGADFITTAPPKECPTSNISVCPVPDRKETPASVSMTHSVSSPASR